MDDNDDGDEYGCDSDDNGKLKGGENDDCDGSVGCGE